VADQRCRQGQHVAFDIFRKPESVHTQRRQHLQGRFVEGGTLAFDFQLRLTLVDVQQLAQIRVPVGLDFPLVVPAASGNRFAVQQIRRRPLLVFPVQLEHRNRGTGSFGHSFNPILRQVVR